MPKTLKEAKDLAQSWIDSYNDNDADDVVTDTLQDLAAENGQILCNVIHMSWFRSVIAEYILSNEGQRG